MPNYHRGDSTTQDAYGRLWNITSGYVAIDLETISIEDRTPLGIGFACEANDGFYFTMDSARIPWHILSNPSIVKLFHNGGFDIGVLEDYCNVHVENWYDTMIAASLQKFNQLSLSAISSDLFHVLLTSIPDLIGKGKNQIGMDKVDASLVAEKCIQDVKYTWMVWDSIKNDVQWDIFLDEMDLEPVLRGMTNRGIAIDKVVLDEHEEKLRRDVRFFKQYCEGTFGFNPGSPKQLAAVLESRGWRVRRKRTTGNPILPKEELEERYSADPLAALVIKYRENSSNLSNINSMRSKHLTHWMLHPEYHQTVASTGRISSSKPNVQNIPVWMRGIVIPNNDVLVDWDLSQIELRALAHKVLTEIGDYTMQGAFDSGADIHSNTAKGITDLGFPMTRGKGKRTNFAIVYLGDENTLSKNLQVPKELGLKFMRAYFQVYPGVEPLIKKTIQFLHDNGYTETLSGRRRYFPELEYHLTNRGDRYSETEIARIGREAFNHTIQGTAAEDLKRLQMRNKDKPQIATVHDEILFDMKFGDTLDYGSCIALAPYRTPMDATWGYSWKECKDEDKDGNAINEISNAEHPRGEWG